MARFDIVNMLSIGLLVAILCICGPFCLIKPWSQVKVERPSKQVSAACRTVFEQYIGLAWISQCNCNPISQHSSCELLDTHNLDPQYYYITMGGILVKVVFSFAMLSTFASIIFIIRKAQRQQKQTQKNLQSLCSISHLLYINTLFYCFNNLVVFLSILRLMLNLLNQIST